MLNDLLSRLDIDEDKSSADVYVSIKKIHIYNERPLKDIAADAAKLMSDQWRKQNDRWHFDTSGGR